MRIILSMIVLLFLIGCGEEKSTPTQVTQPTKKEEQTATIQIQKVASKVLTTQELFVKECSSCHGKNADIKALGKSQIIKGWDAQKILNALNGYINDSYGGDSKALMKSRVTKLSSEEIISLAEYISKL